MKSKQFPRIGEFLSTGAILGLLTMGPLQGALGAAPTTPADSGSTGGADATQNFVSPLGLGSGATISVTQKGVSATASVESQFVSPWVNYWQLGLSGTTNTNGQAAVYSSTDTGAPGFKGKLGIGRSSFLATDTHLYTAAAGKLKAEVWCINVAAKLAGFNISQFDAAQLTSCRPIVERAIAVVQALPSGADPKTTATTLALLQELQQGLADESAIEDAVCNKLKTASTAAYSACPDSGAVDISVEDLGRIYSNIYARIVRPTALPALYYKISFNYSPSLVSTDYRAVTNGVANLATNSHWSSLLNAFAVDGSLYYKAWSFGLEAAYGKTVNIVEQNVCNTTTSGTFTAQQCKNAMIGKPNPANTASATGAISFTPASNAAATRLFRPGLELVAYFEHPDSGGHKTQLSLPLYMAPISAPLKFVIGLQPMWTWTTEPKQTNDFSVFLFVGARPSVPN
jgi:hypothetical protein